MSVHINKHLAKLGFKARDRITGLEGIVTSVCFDLYGCVQVILNPGLDKDGKPREQAWFDIGRLEVISKTPAIQQPDFVVGPVAEGRKGPAEKPANTHF